MNRKTKNARQAFQRLAFYLAVTVIPVGTGRWTMWRDGWTIGGAARTTNSAFAFLADYARRRGEPVAVVRQAVRYYGRTHLAGIPAWGEDAIAWLRMEDEATPPRVRR